MLFGDAVRVLIRRWYIVLAGLVVIAASAGAAIKLVPTDYQASGQVLLLLPWQATSDATQVNPYLNLPPGLTITASLIAGTVTNQDSQRELKAAGFTSEYAIALNPGAGPLLNITVKDTDPQKALAMRDELIDRLDSELVTIQSQEDVPERQMIHSRGSSVTTEAEALPGSKIRVLAVIAAIGTVITLLVAFIVDRFVQAKKYPSRRVEAPAERFEGRAISDFAAGRTLVVDDGARFAGADNGGRVMRRGLYPARQNGAQKSVSGVNGGRAR